MHKVTSRIILTGALVSFTALPLSAGEFLNTLFHLDFGAIFAYPYGDLITTEENSVLIDQTDENGITFTKKPRHYDFAFSMTLDIAPFKPLILGNEAHALKFGVRTAYRFHFLQQELSILKNEDTSETFGGELMSYQTFSAGPVLHYSPSVTILGMGGDYSSSSGFTFFALYSHIVKGSIKTNPAYTEYVTGLIDSMDISEDGSSDGVKYINRTSNSSDVNGYKIDIGMGAEIAVCAFNLGINIFYSMMFLNFSDRIYQEVPRNTRIDELCFEIYAGIPVEWFVPTGSL